VKRISMLAAAFLAFSFPATAQTAQPTVQVSAGDVRYEIDADTLEIRARRGDRDALLVLAPLNADGGDWALSAEGAGWRWSDGRGGSVLLRADGPDLSVTIARTTEGVFTAPLPPAAPGDTWIIPDGEGVAFAAGDPFWRNIYAAQPRGERCLSATAALSMPAWSRLSGETAITYMLADGLQSALCLGDNEGVQGQVRHEFSAGAERIELLIRVGEANPLAPALAYRALLERRGLLRTFADKQVPLLPRLFGAPHAYVWGDGRRPEFLDRLHALGIERMLLATDQGDDPNARGGHAGPDYLARAAQLGFLAGPYESFENAQPPQTSDAATSNWGDELYPAGCIVNADGAVMAGFADRGCELSSEALRQRATPPNLVSRYEAHGRNGVTTVFVDVDAFGDFHRDYSPAHPMTMARDRENRLARLEMGIADYDFVLGSEHVGAWSHAVAHYSHGTAQAHVVWALQRNRQRFGAWWPPERPGFFFKPLELTTDEARTMFGPADRLPLFEAAFHDSVVSTDRWEFSMTKLVGLERQRFARALLYGAPTMWSLDDRELTRVGPWLEAAHDAFRRAHGWETPVALTGFDWLTPDRLVQSAVYADGREIIANFSATPWRGLGGDCVRVTWPGQAPFDLCPPADIPA
jgi:hypothetical protein